MGGRARNIGMIFNRFFNSELGTLSDCCDVRSSSLRRWLLTTRPFAYVVHERRHSRRGCDLSMCERATLEVSQFAYVHSTPTGVVFKVRSHCGHAPRHRTRRDIPQLNEVYRLHVLLCCLRTFWKLRTLSSTSLFKMCIPDLGHWNRLIWSARTHLQHRGRLC